MSGPAPKPTALRVIEGNPSKRPINVNEPVPPAVPVVKPAWLGEIASAEWDRVAPQLEKMRLLADIDTTALAVYCEAYQRYREAVERLHADGMVVESARDDGALVKHPAAQIARDAAAELKAFAAEFGMTPSSRGRINLPTGDNSDGTGGILS